jgi:hypothetical protein
VFESWEAFYASRLQGFWLLVVPAAAFLVWLLVHGRPAGDGADPRAARFVHLWTIVFTVETILDPLLIVYAGVPMLPFVLLGDFRVFLLILGVARPSRPLVRTVAMAAAWTVVVPIAAWGLDAAERAVSSRPLPDQLLWLNYEVTFGLLAVGWWIAVSRWWVPARRWLRAVLAYVVVYYVLWATADVLILSGYDLGWALRVVPNQLYYVFWTPVVWSLFFASRYASTSAPVQASR